MNMSDTLATDICQHAIDVAFGRSKRGGDYDPYAGLRRDRNGDE